MQFAKAVKLLKSRKFLEVNLKYKFINIYHTYEKERKETSVMISG